MQGRKHVLEPHGYLYRKKVYGADKNAAMTTINVMMNRLRLIAVSRATLIEPAPLARGPLGGKLHSPVVGSMAARGKAGLWGRPDQGLFEVQRTRRMSQMPRVAAMRFGDQAASQGARCPPEPSAVLICWHTK